MGHPGDRTIVVPVAPGPDADDIDLLARTCLGLRRLGGHVRVVAPTHVLELLELAGLDEAVELVEGTGAVASVQLVPQPSEPP